jgi:two-component system NtrC family sensor kinase
MGKRPEVTTAIFSEPPTHEPPAVLVVDDVEANLRVLKAVLDNLDCEVVCATSGQSALKILLRRHFAVVLLDLQMPEMDGYEVARHIRMSPARREIPIVFLTAHDAEDHELRAYDSGAVDFLFKPINTAVLRSKVRVFLDLYAGRQQLGLANQLLELRNAELRTAADAEAEVARSLRRTNEELRLAYAELQSTQVQLVHAAKMASLGELVAGVAHEINSPLAFVQSHLTTAQKCLTDFRGKLGQELPEGAEEPWRKAEVRLTETGVGLGRIGDLVLKLRSFSRLDEGERKVASIKESLDSVLTILGHRLQGQIVVETTYTPPDLIDCYPALLNQVLLNLIGNAIDAIAGPGSISISAGADGPDYVISVIDSGPGIPAGLNEKVLEPFFTTKPVGAGTGLGLSIAYSIIQKHHGVLTLGNAPGGGAVATIRLPLGLPTDAGNDHQPPTAASQP